MSSTAVANVSPPVTDSVPPAQTGLKKALRHKSPHALLFDIPSHNTLHVRLRNTAKASKLEMHSLFQTISRYLDNGPDYCEDSSEGGTTWVFDLREAGPFNGLVFLPVIMPWINSIQPIIKKKLRRTVILTKTTAMANFLKFVKKTTKATRPIKTYKGVPEELAFLDEK
jgi:hypothetical protein